MSHQQTQGQLWDGTTVDRTQDRYCLQYDPAGECDLSTLVVHALADVEGIDPAEIEPLNDVVDPDAMDDIFRPNRDGTPREGGQLSFAISGHRVVVHSVGRIEVVPPGDL